MKVGSSSQKTPDTPARLLLIDDNRLGMLARKAVLEELGYEVSTAANGVDGLKRIAEQGFELIVTDFRMPRMDGVQLIAKVRQTHPDVPIVLLTGFADALGLDEETTGANVVIQKSANEVAHMVRAVRRLLRPARKKAASERRATSRRKRSNG